MPERGPKVKCIGIYVIKCVRLNETTGNSMARAKNEYHSKISKNDSKEADKTQGGSFESGKRDIIDA